VNVVSRLEQATKEFQARLLISQAVRLSLDAAMSGVEDLGSVALKGQSTPARIFKVA
jgi:class 3 adenylate cyclase